MEFEALLLGLEPLTALAVGIGAFALAPVVNTLGESNGSREPGRTLSRIG